MSTKNLEIAVHSCTGGQCKQKPDENNLGFGQHFTDHMFTMRWNKDKGWMKAGIS